MIHNGHLKEPGSHDIDVKMSHEPKTKPTLWSLAKPTIIKKLQSLEKGLFEKSSLDNQSWLDKSGLRIEMYMKLVPGSSVSVLKEKMETAAIYRAYQRTTTRSDDVGVPFRIFNGDMCLHRPLFSVCKS